MTEPLYVLKWAHRYGNLEVEDFDSVDEAVRAAAYASGAGEESLVGVEVVYEDGRTEQVEDVWDRIREVDKEHEADIAELPPTVAAVDLKSPGGEWGAFRFFSDRADADRDAEELRETFGADRVRVRRMGTDR